MLGVYPELSAQRQLDVKPGPSIGANWSDFRPEVILETVKVTQTTFPQLLLQHAKQRPQAPALREKE